MNGPEIRASINANNREIERLMTPATFVLNKEISHLMLENSVLRAQCRHEFFEQKGVKVCKWCD